MSTTGVYESHVEEATLQWLDELGYSTAYGEDIAPEGRKAERESFGDVLLVQRLRDAIDRLNPTIPEEAREAVLRDALLPKLLSGEIRIADAEKIVKVTA